MNKIHVCVLVCFLAASPLVKAQCSLPHSDSDPFVQQLISEGAIHVPGPFDNTGIYEWNGELQQHVLIDSWVDDALFYTPITALPGDSIEVEYPIGVPGGEEGVDRRSCGAPPTLPPVIVTTSLPARISPLVTFIRFLGFGGGGTGPVAVNRQGTPVPNNPWNNNPAVCTSGVQERLHHAHQDVAPFAAARWNAQRPLGRGELVTVTYDDGGRETWRAVGGIPSATAYSVGVEPVAGSLKCP